MNEEQLKHLIQAPLLLFDTAHQSVLYEGDALAVLRQLPATSCRTAITSPPYWGLRDYGASGQLGNEEQVEDYVERLVEVFGEVSRVLTDDGTLWLNVGDSYTSGGRAWRAPDKKNPARAMGYRAPTPAGLKPKDLVGVPWRLAFALQADGWYLRSEIIWHKPNATPESVKDRPSRVHEQIFLLTKSESYYYDYENARELGNGGTRRNRRSVWSVDTQPFKEAHFATYPPALVEPCVLAGSQPGDTVLDPFFGSGTTGLVAATLDRYFVGIEIKPEYVQIASHRLAERLVNFNVVKTPKSDEPFPVLVPALQIGFYKRLLAAQETQLMPALLAHLSGVDIAALDAELHEFAGSQRLGRLAAEGLRGELLFPVPLILASKPSLIGYYRLLLGFSQKEFYKPPFSIFARMEAAGVLSSK